MIPPAAPMRTLLLALGLLLPNAALAQNAPDRIAQLEAQHRDSLEDFCLAADAELLRALPAWSDPALRWALFGVPTDAERDALRQQAGKLSELVNALEPLLHRRLREADAENDAGIEAAVQLLEVLIPLARARGLLTYSAAIDPPIGRSDESQRGFQEAVRVASLSESVSAWSDAERELIVALGALRLHDQERALEAVRAVRDALREDQSIDARSPGLVQCLRAAETLLISVARSVSDARTAMPDDPADRQRLRTRLAAIATEQATGAEQQELILRAEADRLASSALDLALAAPLGDRSWIRPLERIEALLGPERAIALGDTARAAVAVLRASRAQAAGHEAVRSALAKTDLGALSVLGTILELGSLAETENPPLESAVRLGADLHRLASDRPIAQSGLRTVAGLIRASIGTARGLPALDAAKQDSLLDLLDVLIERGDLGRSNLDLLATALLPTSDESPDQTRAVFRAAQSLTEALDRSGAADADAARALGLVGAALLDRIARNQIAPIFDDPSLPRDEEAEGVRALNDLAEPLRRIAPTAENPDARSLIALADAMLLMHAAELDDPGDAEPHAPSTPFVAAWVIDLTSTRLALRQGSEPVADPGAQGALFAAAVFADRDVPGALDLRSGLIDTDDNFERAPGALRAGVILAAGADRFANRAIRCFSAALRTGDPQALRSLAAENDRALAPITHPQDRAWLGIIGAEALARAGDQQQAFASFRAVVTHTAAEDRIGRPYWHASMRMLEILSDQNKDGSRSAPIAREIRRLKLQPSWGAHEDICERINAIARSLAPGAQP